MNAVTKTLRQEVWELVRAGFSGIWIETHESTEALLELSMLAADESLRLVTWNLDTGLHQIGAASCEQTSDPLSAVKCLSGIECEEPVLLVLDNFHRFLDSPEIVQALLTQLHLGKQTGRHIIVLAPLVKLPKELERQFVALNHPLPQAEQLWEIAESLVEEPDAIDEPAKASLLDAAAGLTRLEAESAFSLSLVRHGCLISEEIWKLKAKWLQQSGLLTLHASTSGFDTLGGLEHLKHFCSSSLSAKADAKARARGVMLLGVPGTGKSAFARALGTETGRPVLSLDIGQLMGSLVGQSEANIRQALQTADAMSPCILFIDEVEKALSGVASGGKGDSGVSSRLFGTLLTWLNDHESDVYVVVTCNNIQQLPPEFSRAERFDAILFLDLPGDKERESIWQLYLTEFEFEADSERPDDASWTGAEIKACCRLASLLDVSMVEAAKYIVPVGVTAAEDIRALRTWADGRCLDASRPGIFQANADSQAKSSKPRRRRSVSLRPSSN